MVDHHENHPINMFLRDFNDFVRLVLKNLSRSKKAPSKIEIQRALKLAKRLELGAILNKPEQLEGDYLRERKVAGLIRERLIELTCGVMQREN